MTSTKRVRTAALTLFLCAGVALPAFAEKWPGKSPVPGGAVAAKAIGTVCSGVLQPSELDELTTYLSRYLDVIGSRDPQMRERFQSQILPELEKTYLADHSKPDGCNGGAVELAKDMVQRVRAVAQDDGYWAQVLNPPVGAIDAVYAKAVGSVCAGTLADKDAEMLEHFVAGEMDAFGKTSSAADTATTWAYLRDNEKKFADELSKPGMCSDAVREDARAIAGKVAVARSSTK